VSGYVSMAYGYVNGRLTIVYGVRPVITIPRGLGWLVRPFLPAIRRRVTRRW
jgi:hypothetical protein